MKSPHGHAISLALWLFATAAFAQAPNAPTTPAAAPPPEPSAELMQLKPLIDGTRDCRGRIFPIGKDKSERSTRFAMVTKAVLGGFWYSTDITEKKSATSGMPFNSHWTFGYDRAAQKFIVAGFGNRGGHWNGTADGVADGKVIFNGTYTVMKSQTIRDTFTADGHVGEILVDGTWQVLDEAHCTKK